MKDVQDFSKWQDVLKKTGSYFSQRCEDYEKSFEAADWGSVASQQKRFGVFLDFPFSQQDSLLDVGCGQGDLLSFLQERGLFPQSYYGVDLSLGMVQRARARFGKTPKVNFYSGMVQEHEIPLCDYVVASGIFYRVVHESYPFMQAMISLLWAHAKKGLAFNSLSTWGGGFQGTEEFVADPLKVLEMVKTLSPRIALRHNYHPRDFTVFLYR